MATTNPDTPATLRVAGDLHGAAFNLTHIGLPLFAFAVLAGVLMFAGGDGLVADRIYAWEGHQWALREAKLTARVIHIGGRAVSQLAWLGVVATWWYVRSRPAYLHWRRPMLYLALALPLASLLVAWMKSWSNMDCPWDLLRYGGDRPYIALFGLRPVGLSRGACFPAGHSSAGYAWFALYFALRMVRPSWRGWGLALGLSAGAVFGISQQLRGAHFLSHDVWTAAICWFSALLLYRVMAPDKIAAGVAPRVADSVVELGR